MTARVPQVVRRRQQHAGVAADDRAGRRPRAAPARAPREGRAPGAPRAAAGAPAARAPRGALAAAPVAAPALAAAPPAPAGGGARLAARAPAAPRAGECSNLPEAVAVYRLSLTETAIALLECPYKSDVSSSFIIRFILWL